MELKVQCNCGQKFKFDVEPMNGQMPFTVNCPTCGADGTAAANAILAQAPVVPPPAVTAPTPRLQLNRPQPMASAVVATPPPMASRIAAPSALPANRPKPARQFNLGLGIAGAPWLARLLVEA